MLLGGDSEVGGAVVIRWQNPLEGPCPISNYRIWYREVFSAASKSKWDSVVVRRNATSYTLQFHCWKEYEIAMTSVNGSVGINTHAWKFRTGGGEYKKQKDVLSLIN